MSRKFVPRTSAPSKDDRNMIHYEDGGLSICVRIDGKYTMPISALVKYSSIFACPEDILLHEIDEDELANIPIRTKRITGDDAYAELTQNISHIKDRYFRCAIADNRLKQLYLSALIALIQDINANRR